MSPHDLTLGSAYYQVTYADPDMTIPGVMPMIFIGVNVLPNDDDPAADVYYFQDTVSHSWRGSVTDAGHSAKHPEIETMIYPQTQRDVEDEVFTLAEVVALVTAAYQRCVDPGG
jgi:hypothetical protein